MTVNKKKSKMKSKIFFYEFMVYVYENFIYEDWSIYTTFGKLYNKWAWFVRACLVWMISPLLIPVFLFKKSELYKNIQYIVNSPEFQKELAKSNMYNIKF